MLEDRRTRLFAAMLSANAGFVDAVGWLTSGGLFVSFMSGNVTKVGLGLAGRLGNLALGAGLITAFVGGVVAGSLVGRAAGKRQRAGVLWLVTGMLAVAALGLELGLMVPAVLVLAASMGAKNTVFAENGEVKVGLTYMTGALVRVGKRIATAILGGDRLGWVAPATLFLGMVAGAMLGGITQMAIGSRALWVASGVMLALTLYARALPGGREDALAVDEPI
ncbi:YoaK family protein [Sandarakinorhabdus glacialis]|uniref:YoaK family protein n=1 Tax=Sandarakinorhabdus glacialis TaxID=1614636 RepID=UPI001663B2E7|nr:YoaK family protein [Polymorphobacter glacialis]